MSLRRLSNFVDVTRNFWEICKYLFILTFLKNELPYFPKSQYTRDLPVE